MQRVTWIPREEEKLTCHHEENNVIKLLVIFQGISLEQQGFCLIMVQRLA